MFDDQRTELDSQHAGESGQMKNGWDGGSATSTVSSIPTVEWVVVWPSGPGRDGEEPDSKGGPSDRRARHDTQCTKRYM